MNEYKLSDIKLGQKESFKVNVNSSKMKMFKELSGDINPLHNDDDFAKERGFDAKVVYGLLTTSFYSKLVGVYLPGKYCILHSIDVQFTKPVYPEEELIVFGEVVYINEAYKQIEVKAKIIKKNNTVVSKSNIKLGVIDE